MCRFRLHLFGVLVFASSFPAACGTKPAPGTRPLRPAASSIVVFDGLPLAPYRKIREVETTSCARELGREPEISDARAQLRVEAARLGGNAVANVMCHAQPARPRSPCWKIALCTAEIDCASPLTNHHVDDVCRVSR